MRFTDYETAKDLAHLFATANLGKYFRIFQSTSEERIEYIVSDEADFLGYYDQFDQYGNRRWLPVLQVIYLRDLVREDTLNCFEHRYLLADLSQQLSAWADPFQNVG